MDVSVTLSGRITPHFSWEEMQITEHRTLLVRNAEELAADPKAQAAIRVLCETLLEPVRAHFGKPVSIHSGYRCPDLNAAIGGSSTSQHPKGQAADFHVVGVPLQTVFDWIRKESGLPFGQVILEGRIPSWIHLSTGTKREALRWDGKSYSVVK